MIRPWINFVHVIFFFVPQLFALPHPLYMPLFSFSQIIAVLFLIIILNVDKKNWKGHVTKFHIIFCNNSRPHEEKDRFEILGN